MPRPPREVRDRVAGRLYRQYQSDYAAGLRDREPTWREVEDKAKSIGELCDAEKRDGGRNNRGGAISPEGGPAPGTHFDVSHYENGEVIVTHSANANYRNGFEAIDWSK